MESSNIKNIIGYKKDRIEVLKKLQQTLNDLHNEISVSKFKQSFKIVYNGTKRIFFLALMILSFSLALVAFVFPKILFINSESYKNEFVTSFRDNYKEISTKSIDESLNELNTDGNLTAIENNVDKSLRATAEKHASLTIRLLGILFLIIGVLFWYISRIGKNIKERDQLLLKTDSLIEDVIEDYGLSIDEEEREIKELETELQSRN